MFKFGWPIFGVYLAYLVFGSLEDVRQARHYVSMETAAFQQVDKELQLLP